MSSATAPWWRGLERYHWFVIIVAALGWLFDCLDQQLFNAARVPAMRELLGTQDMRVITQYGGYATSIFLMGWATGGLIFGILGDRIGRAKTMLWTILIYSLFTGLSALSTGLDFAISLDKDTDERGEKFIGMEALKRTRDAGGPARKLVGMRVEGKRSPRQGMPVRQGGREVGTVTSGSPSPTLGYPIAMGYVDRALAAPGTAVSIDTGKDAVLEAQVVGLPFYKAK